MLEKLLKKLLEYNVKLNAGKEIRVVEYLKQVDKNSAFMKKFENQKHLRRAFFEEFKVHSFNYVLLLFDSALRMLNTLNSVGLSENYQRFLANRGKMIGP